MGDNVGSNECYSHTTDDIVVHPFEENNVSFFKYTDSMIEITEQLTTSESISDTISDITIINESTLLIAQQTQINNYYWTYSTSLIHIPSNYQAMSDANGQCIVNREINANNDRFWVIDSKRVYNGQLSSKQYYYQHTNGEDA